MNWDWEKLQKQRQGSSGGGQPPSFDDFNKQFERFKEFKAPGWKLILLVIAGIWLLSGIYIVDPAQVGVVKRFGEFNRITQPGPGYRIPWPVESVTKLDIKRVRRVVIGVDGSKMVNRTMDTNSETLMLTGDENIVNINFIVQFQIKNAENYLFNVADPRRTVYNAAMAAMREVIGKSKIDAALTTGKQEIQTKTRDLMQATLDLYKTGVHIIEVQMQGVHPPTEVVAAFKDVASAREDKSRFINEAEAYRNDILPKARGEAARIVNAAEAYKGAKIRAAQGDASKFLSVYREYAKAKEITKKRIYIETMESLLASPTSKKVILSDKALRGVLPLLPLGGGTTKTGANSGERN